MPCAGLSIVIINHQGTLNHFLYQNIKMKVLFAMKLFIYQYYKLKIAQQYNNITKFLIIPYTIELIQSNQNIIYYTKNPIKSIVPFHFQMIWISKTIYQGCIEKYFCVSSAQYNALDIFLLCTSNYCTMVQLCIYETKHAIVVKKPFSFVYR